MTEIAFFSSASGGSRGAADRYTFTARLSEALRIIDDWRERLRTRRDLMRLSDYQLKDIGLSRLDAEKEYVKPFWRS